MSQFWNKVLLNNWQLDGQVSALDGEYDLNFLVQTQSQKYVLKVMRVGCDEALVDMQCAALQHLVNANVDLPTPKVIDTSQGQPYCWVKDDQGQPRIAWLLEALPGVTYAHFCPKSAALIHQLGEYIGHMDKQLAGFDHGYLDRDFKWNLTQGDWIEAQLQCLTDERQRQLVTDICADFKQLKADLLKLPAVAIHNDVNDYNVLAQGHLTAPDQISGIIDLGDMCRAPRVCDLAIAAAYIVLDHDDPLAALLSLVVGYHQVYPLTAHELDMLWPLLRMRLAVSVVNSTLMVADHPHDPYVTISQQPAWDFLLQHRLNEGLLNMQLRAVCGLDVCATNAYVETWLAQHAGDFYPLLGEDITRAPMVPLSVEQSSLPQNPLAISAQEAVNLAPNAEITLGYYNEPRLVYTEAAFKRDDSPISERRTVHLGIDVFAPAGTSLYCPMAATVEAVVLRPGYLDYGAVVILRHAIDAQHQFYSLYGHLNGDALGLLKPGQSLAKGEVFAELGAPSQNGGWDPHVHVQLAMSLAGIGHDWPGAANPNELYLWHQLCPNPAPLLNLDASRVGYEVPNKNAVAGVRKQHFAANLKLTYSDPVMFLRGWQHYLFDEWGRPYLDAYNNVPHVGHAHPRIQQVAAKQLQQVNTNSRYLHPSRGQFAKQILQHLPNELNVCYFVNSGSEANELALRLARAHTRAKHMITPNHGYHGNTTGAIDLSAYKFNAPGGIGPSDWVHLVDLADDYRGAHRAEAGHTADLYAQQVAQVLQQLQQQGQSLAGFIAETFPSVGGQIIPPVGYLQKVYELVRGAGGICIADEVQTALGRLGDYYFAFEQQQVIPDVVVLGKPIGNGHPIGVVITTQEIAASFAQGPEFFSTFGGSNLSCVVGNEVLQIVEDEGLMANAKRMGDRLLAGLQDLQQRHGCIGDVRACGLFVGLDLVTDRTTRAAATDIASYVKNRLREARILIGSEGPYDNILKIRPPLTIDAACIDHIVQTIDQILAATAVQG